MNELALGLDTFGDITLRADGSRSSDAQTIRDIVDEAVRADEVGSSCRGGEHHRHEFAVSSPELVLAAAAARTEKIRLGTAVTVLSSDDPVRVYERFATLDALPNWARRGHPRARVLHRVVPATRLRPRRLRGALFEEKLDLFSCRATRSRSPGRAPRAALDGADVYPKTANGITAWVGVGGSPESVVRTARYGYGLMLAIIGGSAERFRPYVDLYHRSLDLFGRDRLPVGHPFARTHRRHRRAGVGGELYPAMEANRNAIGAERGWPPYSRRTSTTSAPEGAIYAGSPETVARKIAATVQTLGADRFDLKYANGTLEHGKLLALLDRASTAPSWRPWCTICWRAVGVGMHPARMFSPRATSTVSARLDAPPTAQCGRI